MWRICKSFLWFGMYPGNEGADAGAVGIFAVLPVFETNERRVEEPIIAHSPRIRAVAKNHKEREGEEGGTCPGLRDLKNKFSGTGFEPVTFR